MSGKSFAIKGEESWTGLRKAFTLSGIDCVQCAQNVLMVEVEASVTRPEEVSSNQTNTFLFYFHTQPDKLLKRVLPSTLEEAAHVDKLQGESREEQLPT